MTHRRLFYVGLALLLWGAPAAAQITVGNTAGVGANNLYAGGSAYTLTTGWGSYASGDGVIVVMSTQARTHSSVYLGANTTGTACTKLAGAGAEPGASSVLTSTWYCTATGSEASGNIFTNISGSDSNDALVCAIRVTAGWTSTQTGANGASYSSASTQNANPAAVTPATANNVTLYGAYRGNRTWNATSGSPTSEFYTNGNLYACGYKTQTSATNVQFGFTTGDAATFADLWYGAFNGASAGGATTSSRLLMMGVGQ